MTMPDTSEPGAARPARADRGRRARRASRSRRACIADGHTVEVFERDADLRRRQGYYLTINGDGGQALQRLLPPDLFELYLDTSRRPYTTQASVVSDPDLRLLGARPSMGPPNLGERRHTGVDRRTLRRILGAGSRSTCAGASQRSRTWRTSTG